MPTGPIVIITVLLILTAMYAYQCYQAPTPPPVLPPASPERLILNLGPNQHPSGVPASLALNVRPDSPERAAAALARLAASRGGFYRHRFGELTVVLCRDWRAEYLGLALEMLRLLAAPGAALTVLEERGGAIDPGALAAWQRLVDGGVLHETGHEKALLRGWLAPEAVPRSWSVGQHLVVVVGRALALDDREAARHLRTSAEREREIVAAYGGDDRVTYYVRSTAGALFAMLLRVLVPEVAVEIAEPEEPVKGGEPSYEAARAILERCFM